MLYGERSRFVYLAEPRRRFWGRSGIWRGHETHAKRGPPTRRAPPGVTGLADRFESLEQRMERLEHTPIAGREAAPGAGSAGFAPKVIEAVVQAVDERLSDQARQMERRGAELEARVAEVRNQFDAEMAEVRSQFNAEMAAVHDRVEGGMRGFAGE